ncbi:hypothetical protein TNCV_1184581 [Trichonephila clavipes]|nr:hypothetical protein TNCV_1184581 [Trichonephila clavipes]
MLTQVLRSLEFYSTSYADFEAQSLLTSECLITPHVRSLFDVSVLHDWNIVILEFWKRQDALKYIRRINDVLPDLKDLLTYLNHVRSIHTMDI